jgi:hypothetical protein
VLQVRYVIALLRDMLVALDVAQRVLGFAHYDLKWVVVLSLPDQHVIGFQNNRGHLCNKEL